MQGISGQPKIIPGLTTIREVNQPEEKSGVVDSAVQRWFLLNGFIEHRDYKEISPVDKNLLFNLFKFGQNAAVEYRQPNGYSKAVKPTVPSNTWRKRKGPPTEMLQAADRCPENRPTKLVPARVEKVGNPLTGKAAGAFNLAGANTNAPVKLRSALAAPGRTKKNLRVRSADPIVMGPTPSVNSPWGKIPYDIAGFWGRLKNHCADFGNKPVVAPHMIGNNVDGIHCPEATALSVSMHPTQKDLRAFMHANAIRMPAARSSGAGKAIVDGVRRNALAGQSPQEFALCERFFAKALDNQQGIFQFISSATLHYPGQTPEKTMLGQLHQQLTAARQNNVPLILAGRYNVIDIQQLPAHDGNDHRCARIVVDEAGNPPVRKSIVVTEAGLAFDNGLLKTSEIARAHALMNANIKHDSAQPNTSSRPEPMAISYGGIGRNSTLVTYREVLARANEVRDEKSLDAVMSEIIVQGRKDRGPYFIHSEAQLSELRKALVEALGLK